MNEELVESVNSIDCSIISKIERRLYLIIKRLFDIMGGLVGLIVLIPVTIILKICFLLNGDKEKLIFSQNRIGKNGKEFKFYKYRSMVPNADDVLKELLANDKKLAREYKKNKKLENDPRITKVGAFIRKTSIDELPQLLNVLKGDMSLIGNRPYLPREKDDMGMYFNDIVKTKPGMTGYWQTSGRSDVDFDGRLKMEQHYSKHASLRMDIKIFIMTFVVVLFSRGAK